MKTVALRLDDETYLKFSERANSIGSSMAEELREMIKSYVDDGPLRATS